MKIESRIEKLEEKFYGKEEAMDEAMALAQIIDVDFYPQLKGKTLIEIAEMISRGQVKEEPKTNLSLNKERQWGSREGDRDTNKSYRSTIISHSRMQKRREYKQH